MNFSFHYAILNTVDILYANHRLIDKNMKKMDLVEKIGISSSTLAKMSKGEAVSMSIIEKICEELNCDFGDIINYERKGEGQDGV